MSIGLITYQPLIEFNRSYQESLMGDSCVILRGGSLVSWTRDGLSTTIIPCRVGEERTLAVSSDPLDANTRTLNEWAITLPWDIVPEIGDQVTATIEETGVEFSTVVGESNQPQSWPLASRIIGGKPKTAVGAENITYKRDQDGDGVFEMIVGTFATKIVLDRTAPLEVPLRYSQAARTSYAPVRLIFDNQTGVPIQTDDIFLTQGRYGVVVAVTPGQVQQTEARALVDFGGVA